MSPRASILAAVALLSAFASAGPPDEKQIRALVEQLRDEDPEVRAKAQESLRDAGDAAVPELKALANAAEVRMSRLAATLLRKIEFDTRAAAACASGPSFFRWERGAKKAWVKLDAKKREDGGWTLTETTLMEPLTLVTVAEADRDFRLASLTSTVTSGGSSSTIKATFNEGEVVVEENGATTPLPGYGIALTDWSVLRFATALVADPPDAPEMVVWDTCDSEPGSTFLRFGDYEFVPAPDGGNVRARSVKVEGLLVVWIKEDGKVSHATRGEGSFVVAAEAKDVPEVLRK